MKILRVAINLFNHTKTTIMNKTLLITSAICMFTWVSCSNDEVTPVSIPDEIQTTVETGIWVITYFNDSGDDETSYFNGYSFEFASQGILTASNGVNTYTGSWSVSDSNSSDDSPGDIHFNILFNLSNNFEELNDDWHILSRSDSKIELIDISGGNGGTDYLTFERI